MRASDEVCEVTERHAGFLPSFSRRKCFLEIPTERPQIRGKLALPCATIGMCEVFKDSIQKFANLLDIQISDGANGSESQETAPANETRHCSASPPVLCCHPSQYLPGLILIIMHLLTSRQSCSLTKK